MCITNKNNMSRENEARGEHRQSFLELDHASFSWYNCAFFLYKTHEHNLQSAHHQDSWQYISLQAKTQSILCNTSSIIVCCLPHNLQTGNKAHQQKAYNTVQNTQIHKHRQIAWQLHVLVQAIHTALSTSSSNLDASLNTRKLLARLQVYDNTVMALQAITSLWLGFVVHRMHTIHPHRLCMCLSSFLVHQHTRGLVYRSSKCLPLPVCTYMTLHRYGLCRRVCQVTL